MLRARFAAGALSLRGQKFSAEAVVGAFEVQMAEEDEFAALMQRWGNRKGRGSILQVAQADDLQDVRSGLTVRDQRPPPTTAASITTVVNEVARPPLESFASTAVPPPAAAPTLPAPQPAKASRSEARMSLALVFKGASDKAEAEASKQESREEVKQAARLSLALALSGAQQLALKAVKASPDETRYAVNLAIKSAFERIQVTTKLQAAMRGRMVRKQVTASKTVTTSAEADRAAATAQEDMEAIMASRRRMEAAASAAQAAAEAEMATVAMKLQAAERGRQVRKQVQAQQKCASVLQKLVRRWQARKQGNPGLDFASTALLARQRHKAWAASYDEVVSEETQGLMTREGFLKALPSVHPRLASRQVAALWDGFTDMSGKTNMTLATFCSILEAVAIGDRVACEFADMHVDDFVALAQGN